MVIVSVQLMGRSRIITLVDPERAIPSTVKHFSMAINSICYNNNNQSINQSINESNEILKRLFHRGSVSDATDATDPPPFPPPSVPYAEEWVDDVIAPRPHFLPGFLPLR